MTPDDYVLHFKIDGNLILKVNFLFKLLFYFTLNLVKYLKKHNKFHFLLG